MSGCSGCGWIAPRDYVGGCMTKSRTFSHTPALLAGPLDSSASCHRTSEAECGSLWQGFCCLSLLSRRHKGDAFCSAPTGPPLGTVSSLEFQRQVGKSEGLMGGKEGLRGCFSMKQRRCQGISQRTRCLYEGHPGGGVLVMLFPALPGGRVSGSGIS